jgi:hypothetical protein
LATLSASAAVAAPQIIAPRPFPPIDWSTVDGDPMTHFRNDRTGEAKYDYTVFKPDPDSLTPSVVVYFHGYSENAVPADVRTQIDQLVREGSTVVWLRQCTPGWCWWDTATDVIATTSLEVTKDALAYVKTIVPGPLKITFVAHSIGTQVAMRVASGLPAADKPKAAILHDPRGGSSLVKIGADKLAGIPSTMLQIILVAADSVSDSSSQDVVPKLHGNSPSTRKHAWIVPHACATVTGSTVSYTCPVPIGEKDKTDDSLTAERSYYVSQHLSTLDGVGVDAKSKTTRTVSAHARRAFLEQTWACVREVKSGVAEAGCTGAGATFTGVFGTGVAAPKKYPYFMPSVVRFPEDGRTR